MQGFSVTRVWFYVLMSQRYHEHGVGCLTRPGSFLSGVRVALGRTHVEMWASWGGQQNKASDSRA